MEQEPIEIRDKNTKHILIKNRQKIVETLLQGLKDNGKPSHGLISETATKFGVCRKSVGKLWKQAKEQLQRGQVIDIRSKMVGKKGKKRITVDEEQLKQVPLHKKRTIRSLSKATGIKKSTAHRLIQRGEIRAHTNAIKPHLTQENTEKRLKFCLSKLQPTNVNEDPMYEGMYNSVHIDEKYFDMTKTQRKYYLHPNEVDPVRTCKSKRFITKVMFMTAVARPRFGEGGEVLFDGKIGIFPFVVHEETKRKSKNRPAGVMEMKAMQSVTKEVIRNCVINQIIPAIKEKWPTSGETIYIQQDNAKPHISPSDNDFMEAALSDGFDIRLVNQPSNSPDLNILDLGFFRAIDGLQSEYVHTTVSELVNDVEEAFKVFDPVTLNKVWLTHQLCMTEIMKLDGKNNYKIPHIGKDRLLREGNLPTNITVNSEIVHKAILKVNEGILMV